MNGIEEVLLTHGQRRPISGHELEMDLMDVELVDLRRSVFDYPILDHSLRGSNGGRVIHVDTASAFGHRQ